MGEIQKHKRTSLRLKGYDYSEEGAYFVTIVTHDREPLFGKVVDGKIVVNEYGEIVNCTWNDLINHNENIDLDEYIVMAQSFSRHNYYQFPCRGGFPNPPQKILYMSHLGRVVDPPLQ